MSPKKSSFTLPKWIKNISLSLKTISIIASSTIAILVVVSQVWSFGLDWSLKIQQIERNRTDIAYEKCIREKVKIEADLSYLQKKTDYHSYGLYSQGSSDALIDPTGMDGSSC